MRLSKLLSGLAILGAVRVSTAQAQATADTRPFASATGAFIALSVPDLEASLQWYERYLGLRRVMTIPRMGPIVGGGLLEGDGVMVEFIQHEAAKPGTTPSELTHGIAKAGVLVADFEGTVNALRARGVTFFAGPYPGRPGQRPNVMFKDNSGNMWQILGPTVPR